MGCSALPEAISRSHTEFLRRRSVRSSFPESECNNWNCCPASGEDRNISSRKHRLSVHILQAALDRRSASGGNRNKPSCLLHLRSGSSREAEDNCTPHLWQTGWSPRERRLPHIPGSLNCSFPSAHIPETGCGESSRNSWNNKKNLNRISSRCIRSHH